MILLALFLRPALVVGMPVRLANFRLALVTPKARFAEKVRPGILKLLFFLRAISDYQHFLHFSKPRDIAVSREILEGFFMLEQLLFL